MASEQEPDSNKNTDLPGFGVLIQSTIPCSTIKCIHYGKFWRQDRDLLLVKDKTFEICTLDSDLNLKPIADSGQLDGIIKSSIILPEEYVIIDQNGSPSLHTQPQIFVFILEEIAPQEPQRQLVFMCPCESNTYAYSAHIVSNISQGTMGTIMASERGGRLLAIAARSGAFCLYRLQPWSAAKQGHKLELILEECMMRLEHDHLIWHMDFVPSPANEHNLAYLLMVVETVDKHAITMIVYRIDCTRPLRAQTLQPLRQDELGSTLSTLCTHGLSQVQFVAPLQNKPGVIMGAEDGYFLIPDIRQPKFLPHLYPTTDEPNDRNRSSSKLLYNKWCRPCHQRASQEDTNSELVYVARQDGHIILLSIQHNHLDIIVEVCRFGCVGSDTGKFFTIIHLPNDENVICITGGSNSNDVMVSIKPDNSVNLRVTIPNTESITDTTLVPRWNRTPEGGNRVFAISNRGFKHNSISEMRYGVAIQVLENISTADVPTDGTFVSKVWILPHHDENYLVTTTPNGSACQLYQFNKNIEFKRHVEGTIRNPWWLLVNRSSNHPWFSIFEDGEETLAIAQIQHSYYLRVTRSKIQHLSSDLDKRNTLLDGKAQDLRIMSAIIDSHHAKILFVVIHNDTYNLYCLTSHDEQPPTIHSRVLDSEPSCIYMYNVGYFFLAILSTHDSKLELYALEELEIPLLTRHTIETTDGLCESLSVLPRGSQNFQHGEGLLLMCGFRSGLLKCFIIIFKDYDTSSDDFMADPKMLADVSSSDDITLEEQDSISLGFTSVRIMPDQSQEKPYSGTESVFIFCEERLYVFKGNGCRFNESNLKQLWYVDSEGKGLRQPAILSLAVIPTQSLFIDDNGYKHVFCVTRDMVHHCRMHSGYTPRNLPWQIQAGGSPRRILWSNHHKRLVVGLSLEIMVDASRPSKSKDRPFLYSAIMIVDPNTDQAIQPKLEHRDLADLIGEESAYAAVIEPSGAQISSLAEWDITRNDKIYHMLIVSIFETSSGGGNIHIYNFRTANKPLKLKATYRVKEKGSIHAVAVYDSTTLIVLTDQYLIQLQLSSESGSLHFLEIASIKLKSSGTRHLRIRRDQIIIGTEAHGLQIFGIRGNIFGRFLMWTSGSCTTDSISIPTFHDSPDLIIQVQPNGNRKFLYSHILGHHQGSLELFKCILPCYITSLQEVSLKSRPQDHKHLPFPRISAFALDGTVYSLDVIPIQLWRVLKFLQNLIKYQGVLCPFISSKVRERALEGDNSAVEDGYVNGDILRKLLMRDNKKAAVNHIASLISTCPVSMHYEVAMVVGQNRIKEVGGLAEAVVELLEEVVNAI